jgi:uncharacterized protein YbcV (DUF1398 family)
MILERVMDNDVKTIVHECTRISDEGRVRFGEVVQKLIGAGVERYHCDLLRSEKIYYLPDGKSERVPNDDIDVIPAQDFSAAGVEAAVRAIQAGKIKYKEFCERVMTAGCVGYIVSIAGQRAVYYGRTGDIHVEWFPGTKSR